MINLNANVTSVLPNANKLVSEAGSKSSKSDFSNTVKAMGKYISQVDDLQQSSDMSIKDLLSGKSVDITTVVSEAAKADMSFKLLVGVRNKLIEAYKETMNMPL
jgi:flagellar hook-basal body complex protein FliE